MNQKETPLFDALIKWKQKNPFSFHVPGHKNGTVFAYHAKQIYESMLSIDATELHGLDDLHEPGGAILKAQRLAAQLYGSDNCYFLVGGSTAGNLAMILATCREQEIVFVQRNSHKSIMNALELANAKPVFLTPFVDEETNVAVGVTLETVKTAYAAYPEAKVLLLTNPNYYGMTIDLQAIIEFAHERGMIVLIDEAHGAHFGIGAPFPNSAVSLGADVVVQSAHKMLPAMTMGSFLHVNERYPFREKLLQYLSMLQSSSPSYPIMASLDLARYYVAQIKHHEIKQMLHSFEQFKKRLMKIKGLRLTKGDSSRFKQDPLKVIVQSAYGINGFRLQKELERRAVYTELADKYNVLFVLPLAPIKQSESIINIIEQAVSNQEENREEFIDIVNVESVNHYSSLAISYKEMANLPKKSVSFYEAVGKVSAEAVIPYPPGIPLLMKGEVISVTHIEMIQQLLRAGSRFQGGSKLFENQLLIVK